MMIRKSPRLLMVGVVVSIALLATGAGAQRPDAGATLGVAGRSNATPWVAALGPFVAVAWGGSTPDGKTDAFVATSRDGGRTFGAPVRVNHEPGEAQLKGERTPRLALVATDGAPSPEVVVLWTAKTDANVVRLTSSRDGGRTFAAATDLQGNGAAGNRGWASMAVDTRGVAHAFWLDHRGTAAMAPGTMHVHGAQPTAGQPAAAAAPPRDPVASAQRSALYYASVSGRSATARRAADSATPEREITKGVCYCCKTGVATGPGGIVAAAWRHVYPGNFRDIAFTMSRDGGRSFLPMARVSEDGWAIDGCPEDGPAVAVDATGTVHVVWPTVIGGSNPQGALFYASTRDGKTFTPRQRIPTLGGPKPEHPTLVVDSRGRIAVAWDELVKSQRVAAVRPIERTAAGVTFGRVTQLGAGAPAAYPVIAATADGVIAVWTGGPSAAARIGVQRIALDGRVTATR